MSFLLGILIGLLIGFVMGIILQKIRSSNEMEMEE